MGAIDGYVVGKAFNVGDRRAHSRQGSQRVRAVTESAWLRGVIESDVRSDRVRVVVARDKRKMHVVLDLDVKNVMEELAEGKNGCARTWARGGKNV